MTIFKIKLNLPCGKGMDGKMMFRKMERRKLPLCSALVVGGLAVIGFCSLKRKAKNACASMTGKMKKMLSRDGDEGRMMYSD